MTPLLRYFAFSALIALTTVSLLACRETKPDTGGVDRYNRGISFLERGEYKNAITEFKAALRSDPSNFEAQKDLAGAYVLDGNFQEARDSYLAARDMRPNDPSIYSDLAYVYQSLGETQLAWDNIEKALQYDPGYPLAKYRSGELYLAQGDSENALAAFGECLSLESNSRLYMDAQEQIDKINSLLGATVPPGDQEGQTSGVETEDQAVEDQTTEEATADETASEQAAEETVGDEGTEETAAPDEETPDEEQPATETAEEEPAPAETTEEDQPAEVENEPAEPPLTGDALYEDRLSRGRQMRAIGSSAAAIGLLLEAYDVHPDYAQVNYELGLAYLLDGQTSEGKGYLQRYIELETDPDLRAKAEERLRAIEGDDAGGDEGEG